MVNAPMARPTALVRMADAGDLYISWRWTHDLAATGIGIVPRAQLTAAITALNDALPDAGADPLRHALTDGAFASYGSELALAEVLSRTFLPYGLAKQLYELYQRGVRPHLRIQPSPRVAQVPWELLAPDPDVRLVEIADISLLAPASVVHAAGRPVRPWAGSRHLPVVGVLDPRVPGFRADSALGSVLGRMTAGDPVAELVAGYVAQRRWRPEVADPVEAFRRTDVDREWLGATLGAGASRLLYVGHVTAAAPATGRSEDAQLHLACGADAVGFAPPVRAHRPLSAKDLLLGTHGLPDADPADTTGRARWPVPSRVALIACESGGDLRFGEALGLATAMVHGGAETVTTGRWTLPTDLAFHRIAGAAPTSRPLQDAVRAIDAAHEEDDAVLAHGDWQRERLAAWRALRTVEHSPVLWGAFATLSTAPTD
ncbi:CHAT domain-containing protein [Streptomyces sp. JV176]|uniref:CHAT domain-containing protein n=1 Tax=Streptomyces sp. JV176 TaxID=858630 RepID=UPI002E75B8DE|nr:CHAT domain-containing protein [Streptomyces sp. JV176]MEE1804211.1 CHAT domain-containing protein [Streptomyces sp. JV176]